MHDEVGPQIQSACGAGRGACAVNAQHRPGLMRDLGGARDIDDRPAGVGGRLDPHKLGPAALDRFFQAIDIVRFKDDYGRIND